MVDEHERRDPSQYESKVGLSPKDPRKKEYERVEIKARFVWVILIMLLCFGLALLNIQSGPTGLGPGTWLLRFIIDVIGWRLFWNALGGLFTLVFLFGLFEFFKRGTADSRMGMAEDIAYN